ncbi:MAG TPA: glutamine amidotransferase, partial [Armatimonadota bacterium]|nr:glutamine amidotransferase [Armatimonadota bacterium]
SFDYGGTPLDEIYLSSSLLAAGAHPYYGVMERGIGQYPRFALRYAEYLYNNTMRPLKDPEAVISFGAPAKFMDWQWLARTVSLGGNRQRLVIHLLNAPAVPNTLSNLALKTPPVLRQLPVTVKLPAGAAVSGAWSLCPIPDAHHLALDAKKAGDAVTVTVPEVRFWNVVVIDYTANAPLPAAAPRAIPLPPDRKPATPKPAVTPEPDEVIAQQQGAVPPPEWVFPAPTPLSILAVHGLWYHEYGLDRAFALLGGTRVTDTWYQHGTLRFYPESYEALMDHHLLVIADIDAATFGPVRRAQIKRFVEAGGGVLFLGGRIAYRANQQGTAFAEMLPITIGAGDNRKSALDGLALAPAKDALKGFGTLNWAQGPRVYYYHDVTPKAGSTVRLTAGDKPMLVTGTFGKGRVAVFLGSVQGLPKAGQTPCWAWSGWSGLMAETLAWLAEPATKPQSPAPELLAKMKADLLGPGVKKADKHGPVITRYARVPGNAETALTLLKAVSILDGDVPVDLGDAVWDGVREFVTADGIGTAELLLEGAASAKKSLGLRTLGQLKAPGARAQLEDAYKNPDAGGPGDDIDGGMQETITEDPAFAAYIIRLGALEGLGNLGDPAALPLLKNAVRAYDRQRSKPSGQPREVTKEDELYQEAVLSALRCGDAAAAALAVDALLENRYVIIRMTAFLDSPDYPGPEHEATRRQKAKIRREMGRVHQRQARLYGKLAALPAHTLAPLATRIAAEEDRRVAAIAFAAFAGLKTIPADVQAILKTANVAAVRELVGTK